MLAIETAEEILRLIDSIKEEYEINYALVGEANLRQSDLLHELEFNSIAGKRGHRIASDLKKVREARRQAKDANDVAYQIYDFLNESGTAKSFVTALASAIGRAKKREGQLAERIWTPKCGTPVVYEEGDE